MIVEIALNLPLRKTFDYIWPKNIDRRPITGLQVLVPFGMHKKGGVVVGVKKHSDFKSKLKKIEQLINDEPLFSKEILDLSKWTSEYYFCGWGETLNAAIPGGLSLRFLTTYNSQKKKLPKQEFLSNKFFTLVQNNDCWTDKELIKCNPNKKDINILNDWITKKNVLKTHSLVGQKNKIKVERWIRLSKPLKNIDNSYRRKTKRQQIIEILHENPKICWSDILNRINSPSQVLNKLKDEGIIEIFEKRVYRRFLEGELPAIEPFQVLNHEQDFVFKKLCNSLQKGVFNTFLLEGITGSGKTEVYLHAVLAASKLGKSSLILVPEISLTPQLVNRFRSRFGDLVAVLHSGMDDGERFDEWSRVKNGLANIVIGARSAVFSPLNNIGLIIIDEEHDTSYKQGDSPRYQGRDTAIYRGYITNSTVLLGSATPSLESSNNVNIGKYNLLQLTSRIDKAILPEVKLLDMKTEPRQKGSPYFSSELVESLRARLLKKEQSILFLNRRGFAPLVSCKVCEITYTCPNCSLSLVYHQGAEQIRCHQCDYSKSIQHSCSNCGSKKDPKIVGTGTEQIEDNLKIFFPKARILRMDRDSLHGKHALSKMHDRIRNHEVDIIIGTQLVAKGHDFPEVTLVGVILSDLSLNIPDFRASERTFQLLTQVAGRAGRGEKPGEVIIQTYNPKHHSFLCAQNHDTNKFKKIELERRKFLKMPPFHSLTMILCSSPNEERARIIANGIVKDIKNFVEIKENNKVINSITNPKNKTKLKIIGPVEAPIKKMRNRYRCQILLKSDNNKQILYYLNHVFNLGIQKKRNELIQVDVDVHHLL